MSAQAIIERLRAQRESWCVLREADADQVEVAVKLRRPAEVELQAYRGGAGRDLDATLTEAACSTAVDWRGMTEAELLGAAIGSSDELPFNAELWREAVRDRLDWLGKCASHVMQAVAEHFAAKAEQRKN